MRKLLLFVLLLTILQQNTWATDYGFCAESVVPVRKYTLVKSEQVTQLLFGDAFKILKTSPNKLWVYIENHYDDYQGWVQARYVTKVSEKYYQAYDKAHHPVVADMLGYVQFKGKKVAIAIGCTLPFYKDGFITIGEKQVPYEGKVRDISKKFQKPALITTAKRYLGRPYLWGGKSPKGLDCSGFVQMVYKTNGYRLPRDSRQQVEKGKLVKFSEAKVGDLAFFTRYANTKKVIHVGIVMGNGKIIHSDGKVRINTLDKTGIYRDDRKKYSHYLKYIKRLD